MAVSGQIAARLSSPRRAVNRFTITADESNQRGVVKQSRSLFKMTATGNKIKERSNSGERHGTNPGLKACVCSLSLFISLCLSMSLFLSHIHTLIFPALFFIWRGHENEGIMYLCIKSRLISNRKLFLSYLHTYSLLHTHTFFFHFQSLTSLSQTPLFSFILRQRFM